MRNMYVHEGSRDGDCHAPRLEGDRIGREKGHRLLVRTQLKSRTSVTEAVFENEFALAADEKLVEGFLTLWNGTAMLDSVFAHECGQAKSWRVFR